MQVTCTLLFTRGIVNVIVASETTWAQACSESDSVLSIGHTAEETKAGAQTLQAVKYDESPGDRSLRWSAAACSVQLESLAGVEAVAGRGFGPDSSWSLHCAAKHCIEVSNVPLWADTGRGFGPDASWSLHSAAILT